MSPQYNTYIRSASGLFCWAKAGARPAIAAVKITRNDIGLITGVPLFFVGIAARRWPPSKAIGEADRDRASDSSLQNVSSCRRTGPIDGQRWIVRARQSRPF